jgi:transcriptional regulator with XRE-family HTH domain
MESNHEGNRLETLLVRRKITKTKFAEMMGMARNTLWTRLQQPQLDDEFAIRAAQALGANVSEVTGDRTLGESEGEQIEQKRKVTREEHERVLKELANANASIAKLKAEIYDLERKRGKQ